MLDFEEVSIKNGDAFLHSHAEAEYSHSSLCNKCARNLLAQKDEKKVSDDSDNAISSRKSIYGYAMQSTDLGTTESDASFESDRLQI